MKDKKTLIGTAGQITALCGGVATMRDFSTVGYRMSVAQKTKAEYDGTQAVEAQIKATLPDGREVFLGVATLYEVDLQKHPVLPSEEWPNNSPGLRFAKGWQGPYLAKMKQ